MYKYLCDKQVNFLSENILVINHLKLQLFFTFVCIQYVVSVYCPHLACLDIT